MSSWSYCPRCDAGLDICKLHEAIEEHMLCPNCGKDIPANADVHTAGSVLENRLEIIEAKLKELK